VDAAEPRVGELMHEHWEHKKRRTAGMSNPQSMNATISDGATVRLAASWSAPGMEAFEAYALTDNVSES
jgi:hypothetical protein